MNATEFGYLSDRAFNRGACMWAWDREWCAKPVVVENYRGSWHTPDGYRWGHLYGIHVPDGRPEYDSMWICDEHKRDFLVLNSQGNLGTTIWAFDNYGYGDEVTWVPMLEVSVRIRTHNDEMALSDIVASGLDDLLVGDHNIESWDYLKVVAVS